MSSLDEITDLDTCGNQIDQQIQRLRNEFLESKKEITEHFRDLQKEFGQLESKFSEYEKLDPDLNSKVESLTSEFKRFHIKCGQNNHKQEVMSMWAQSFQFGYKKFKDEVLQGQAEIQDHIDNIQECLQQNKNQMLMTTKLTIVKMDKNDELCEEKE